jgi:release factor glutamine methyltransferase
MLKRLIDDSRLPRLEARMLLEYVLDKPRSWLLAHDTDSVEPAIAAAYEALVARRLAGEPMAYILGWREFMGHRLAVTPDVLIPRPDTELLVETALDRLVGLPGPRVLDLGTGSGAIALALALRRPDAVLTATDVSAAALVLAQHNARTLGAAVDFLQGAWYEPLPAQVTFDLIVANPPYIAAADPHLERGDLRFEPRLALTDGADGLHHLRAIVAGAVARLKPGGSVWLEHGWEQAAAVRALLKQAGFRRVGSQRDLAQIERVSGGYL